MLKQGRHHGGGGGGGRPPKGFKKGKISFSVIFNKEIHTLRGLLYHDFGTKKAPASGGFAP